jgi:phosphate transport system permease protein
MPSLILAGAIAILGLLGYGVGAARARAFAGAQTRLARLHSRPGYHGLYVAFSAGLPALLLLALWQGASLGLGNQGLGDKVPFLAGAAFLLALSLAGLGLALGRLAPGFRARTRVERLARGLMLAASTVAILITAGIVLSLLFEALRFFARVKLTDFLFGLEWSPQTALREDQVASAGAFGAVPLFAGTLMVTMIAMAVAAPIGLLAAIYLSEYAGPRLRALAKPALEMLAGVPTVVYGFFAALTVAPALRQAGAVVGLDVAAESALAAGLVMGVMIIPFVSSLSDDVMNAVPQSLRDGSYALGATKSETIAKVVFPAALPGIVGALLLAVSRAIGETMIVVMAAGLAANLTANPLAAATTVTVQIVALLVGDQEFDSAKTLAAFALGLTLFVATLALNVVALAVVRRYRERYV